VRWKHKGDWRTKEFFKWVREKPKPSLITELQTSQGGLISTQHELEQTCHEYYKNLYSIADQQPPPNLERDILNLLHPSFTPTMNATLGRPLTANKLGQAAKSLTKDKTPGIDGNNVEFYSSFWPLIGDEFTEMVNLALDRGSLVPGMTQGLITLIYKTGDRTNLGN
jgi:hypothetical protein